MAFDREVILKGVDALNERLRALDYDMRRKGGRSALRQAAVLIRKAAQQNARRLDDPQTAADIEKNLTERWSPKFNRQTGALKFRVGIMGGAGGSKTGEEQSGLPGGDTRHWRYLEFGTEKMGATPFMRPAMENNLQAAADTFIRQYNKSLDRLIRKASK